MTFYSQYKKTRLETFGQPTVRKETELPQVKFM